MLWWMLQTSVVTAVLIAVVATACRLGRLRPAVQHVLWLVVLVKLATPNVVAWPWTIEQLATSLHRTESVAERETQVPDPITRSFANSSAAETVASGPVGALATRPLTEDEQTLVQDVIVQPARSAENWAKLGPGAEIERASDVLPAASGQPPSAKPRNLLLDAQFVPRLLMSLWVGGMLVYVARQGRRIVQFQRRLRTCRDIPAWLQQSVQKLSAELRHQPPRLLVVRDVASPCLWCVGSPKLIWPERLADDPQPVRWQGIIVHELAHLKRRDHWVAWLELAVGCVWWWNPLYWLVRRRLRETADLSCDAWAVSLIADDQRVYAESLLEITAKLSHVPLAAPVLGASLGTRRAYQRRLEMIMSAPVPRRASFVGILCAGLLAALAVPAWSLENPTPPSAAATVVTDPPSAQPASEPELSGTPTTERQPRTATSQDDLRDRLEGRLLSDDTPGENAPAEKLTGAQRLVRDVERLGLDAERLNQLEVQIQTRLLDDDAESKSAAAKLTDAERLERQIQTLIDKLKLREQEVELLRRNAAPEVAPSPREVDPERSRIMMRQFLDARQAQQDARQAQQEAQSQRLALSNADRFEGSTAGLSQSLAGSQIDLIRLATEISDAAGEMKLTAHKAHRMAALAEQNAVSEEQVLATKISYETASNKVALLRAIAEATKEATKEDLDFAQRMVEKGYGTPSSVSQFKAKLRVLQMILSTGTDGSTEKGRLDDDDSTTSEAEKRGGAAGF